MLPPRPINKLLLFDVDGTLTPPRNHVESMMEQFLIELRSKVYVGIVGGSDLIKIKEQLGVASTDKCDFLFAENGLEAFRNGETTLIARQSLKEYLGDVAIAEIVNTILRYVADLEIPVKRGTFVEFRNGMINLSPIGRNCSQEERDAFFLMDKEKCIRAKMVEFLSERFAEKYKLKFSIGGQISIDMFPQGWDKSFCLQFLKDYTFDEIHFFGDKTYPGGNDYEIFIRPEVIGHTVTSPSDTIAQVSTLIN